MYMLYRTWYEEKPSYSGNEIKMIPNNEAKCQFKLMSVKIRYQDQFDWERRRLHFMILSVMLDSLILELLARNYILIVSVCLYSANI